MTWLRRHIGAVLGSEGVSETCATGDGTKRPNRPLARHLKRGFDIAVAGSALVACAPLMSVTALAVWADVGRPILFKQPRGGQHGRVFQVLKFRTMKHAMDAQGRLLPDEVRLTAVGKFLRAASLDELPQLWNVLRGEMSIVGPRPFLAEYLPLYNAHQRRRHEVPPGITGWAQVHGRNGLTWEERFDLDVWYVDNWTFALDLKILAQTFGVLFKRRGISAADHATMPLFAGSKASS